MTEKEMMNTVCHKTLGREIYRGELAGRVYTAEKCLGSTCAAWRWFRLNSDKEEFKPLEDDEGNAHGYCGLAGKP